MTLKWVQLFAVTNKSTWLDGDTLQLQRSAEWWGVEDTLPRGSHFLPTNSNNISSKHRDDIFSLRPASLKINDVKIAQWTNTRSLCTWSTDFSWYHWIAFISRCTRGTGPSSVFRWAVFTSHLTIRVHEAFGSEPSATSTCGNLYVFKQFRNVVDITVFKSRFKSDFSLRFITPSAL